MIVLEKWDDLTQTETFIGVFPSLEEARKVAKEIETEDEEGFIVNIDGEWRDLSCHPGEG